VRLGYAVAAVLVAAAATVWFGLPLGGALGQRFDAGAPIDVRLDANRVYMIWTIGSTTPACDLRPVAETGPADVEFVVENDPGVDLGAAGRTWRGRTTGARGAGRHVPVDLRPGRRDRRPTVGVHR
jgi:hypothetical protein